MTKFIIQNNGYGILIKNDSVKYIKPASGELFTLKELQQFVDGYIEIVPSTSDDYVVICNEEGLLKGLYFNVLAFKMGGVRLFGNIFICPKSMIE